MINTLFILITTSMACGILGVFLILRKLSMLTDAISHTVLLGIVIAYFFVRDLSSPALIIGATITGLITVYLVELLGKSRFAKYEDAIGIIFPVMFALAVVLVSKYFKSVHLDIDVVLLGEVIFSSLLKTSIFGIEISKALLQSLFMLGIIVGFVVVFFKELKVSTFDPEYAKLIGIPVGVIFYMLITLTSFTSVISFNSVGAILVISFFIAPSATALLVSNNLRNVLLLTCVFSIINCTISYALAVFTNSSMSGMCAFVNMLTYLIVLISVKNKNKGKVEFDGKQSV